MKFNKRSDQLTCNQTTSCSITFVIQNNILILDGEVTNIKQKEHLISAMKQIGDIDGIMDNISVKQSIYNELPVLMMEY